MTNAANPRHVAAAKKQQARDKATNDLVIRTLMGTIDGRRWVWLRLSECSIFAEDENLDPQRMAFNKGKRTVGLALLADVTRITPASYVQMTEEASGLKLKDDENDGPDDAPGE